MASILADARAEFHDGLIGSGVLRLTTEGLPSVADGGSPASVAIAKRLYEKLGVVDTGARLKPQSSGSELEGVAASYLRVTLAALGTIRPGEFEVLRNVPISSFDQYDHLLAVALAAKNNDELRIALGQDYLVKPDVVVARLPANDELINGPRDVVCSSIAGRSPMRASNGGKPTLHASLSCKVTLRSDRAQNARSEALNLIRNRKGRLPHIAVLTAEPLPGRISSLALGTGDIDCVYHVALEELIESVNEVATAGTRDLMRIMVEGRRLRDIADLPLDLAI